MQSRKSEMNLFSRLLNNGLFVVHSFTTLVLCGLFGITTCITLLPKGERLGPATPTVFWFSSDWPYHGTYWAMLLGGAAVFGIMGCVVMATTRNKYLILLSTTVVAITHLYVADAITTSFRLATGTTTYPAVFLISLWCMYQTMGRNGADKQL